MARFKAGDKVVLSETAFRENEGSLWISEVCEFLRKNKFLIVKSISSPSSYDIQEFPRYLFDESWLEPYIEGTPAPLLSGPLYRPPEDKMTLRDQFAMAALTGLAVGNIDLKTETIVTEAYKIADAMMERRKG